jgi:uncharacterized glyoxalase superfamily protein PhnB
MVPHRRLRLVAGEDRVAPSGPNECLLSVSVPDEDAVRICYAAALAIGNQRLEPAQQKWGAFAAQAEDPTGICG